MQPYSHTSDAPIAAPSFGAAGRLIKVLVVGALLLTISACVAITAASGPYKVGRGYTVTLPLVWSDISAMSARLPYVKTLTREGRQLDLMFLTDGIAPGQALTRRVTRGDERRGDTQVAVVRANMNELELVEFVVDSLAAEDYADAQATDIVPVSFAGRDGVGFGFSAKTARGLNVRGLARAMQADDGKVYVMLFLSPEEHYFGQLASQVTAVFDSARF